MSSTADIPSWARDKAEQVYDKWDGEYLVDLGKCSFALQDEFARALAEIRANALEEAALRCEQVTDKYTLIDDRLSGMRADIVSEECAREIRALKNKTPTSSPVDTPQA